MPTKAKAAAKEKPLKDPKGGLTAAGRAHFKETEGADLKPGVKGAADTPEKQKRKGSFLRRHFANPDAGPLTDDKGEPTRHALSAAAWGEPVPKTEADVKKLAKKGGELLEQYHEATDAKAKEKPAVKKSSATAKKAASAKAKTAPKAADAEGGKAASSTKTATKTTRSAKAGSKATQSK